VSKQEPALGLLTKQVINSFISILNNFDNKSSASFPPIYRSELSFTLLFGFTNPKDAHAK
jgi:hypothetical protein